MTNKDTEPAIENIFNEVLSNPSFIDCWNKLIETGAIESVSLKNIAAGCFLQGMIEISRMQKEIEKESNVALEMRLHNELGTSI